MKYEEQILVGKIEKAIGKVKTILDTTREPCFMKDVSHSYSDKFRLVEQISQSSIEAFLHILFTLGLKEDALRIFATNGNSTKTLRFESKEQCRFLRESTRKTEDPKSLKVSGDKNWEAKSYTTITEFHWEIRLEYRLFIFVGSESEKSCLDVCHGNIVTDQVITKTKTSPMPESTMSPFIDLDITPICHFVSNDCVHFAIDRTNKSCYTPRRNKETDTLLEVWNCLEAFEFSVFSVFRSFGNICSNFDQSVLVQIEQICDSVFLPSLPLMDKSKQGEMDVITFSDNDRAKFIEEFKKSMETALLNLEETLLNLVDVKRHAPLLSVPELRLLALVQVARNLGILTQFSVQSVEEELRKQIVAAIGKECTVKDIDKYMQFHYSKLYHNDFLPTSFCYDVRRRGYTPEGSISIQFDDTFLNTVCRLRETGSVDSPSMKFALNAATNVKFSGRQFLHGIVLHKFSTQDLGPCNLTARARQFSAYIVMVGHIAGRDKFAPKHSIIIQNKDDLKIPLLFQTMPSAHEFRDAIESLSPEQQKFAKAFREMQLESSLFGILVIPIKPLMEKLLNLPDGSLTKEIRLTQNLMKLFIEYQVPSDLLTFSGQESLDISEKVRQVFNHATRLDELITESSKIELQRQRERTEFAVEDHIANVVSTYDGGDFHALPFTLSSEDQKVKSSGRKTRGKHLSFSTAAMRGDLPPAPPMAMMARTLEAPAGMASGSAIATMESVSTAHAQSPRKREKDFEEPDLEDEEIAETNLVNYAKIPKLIDRKFESLNEAANVRPTTIELGDVWSRERQKSLLSPLKTEWLHSSDQKRETNQAMDLIDALSRSGEIELTDCDLHVIVAVTHCFDETVIDTVVKKNYNPVTAIETTNIILNATIQDKPIQALVRPESYKRLENDNQVLLSLKNK